PPILPHPAGARGGPPPGSPEITSSISLSGHVKPDIFTFRLCACNLPALQYPAEPPADSSQLPFFWILHKIIGITVIIMFLLAVRRRLSR
ncbi:MAG: hypothetical protein ABIK11_02465, partial [candidate division WOR-3 bacterium]